mmetsp:Transcript_21488/g.49709  ORF Transcript_21488/g.49709 Transcript_21488/m.49709 type:complete len:206 (+) Transcript_21488:1011-1628(+)
MMRALRRFMSRSRAISGLFPPSPTTSLSRGRQARARRFSGCHRARAGPISCASTARRAWMPASSVTSSTASARRARPCLLPPSAPTSTRIGCSCVFTRGASSWSGRKDILPARPPFLRTCFRWRPCWASTSRLCQNTTRTCRLSRQQSSHLRAPRGRRHSRALGRRHSRAFHATSFVRGHLGACCRPEERSRCRRSRGLLWSSSR